MQGTHLVGIIHSCCADGESNMCPCLICHHLTKNSSKNGATPLENGHTFLLIPLPIFVQNDESFCNAGANYFHLTFT